MSCYDYCLLFSGLTNRKYPLTPNNAYSYEATKIELLAGTLGKGTEVSDAPNTSNSLSAAKLLKGVEKTYEPGKNLLDESEKVGNDGVLYREGDKNSSTDKFVDDVRMYDEMMNDESGREVYPLSAFIRDNVRDGVYDEDFGRGLLGMSDEGLRAEADRLMGMGGERLDGMEAYRRLAGEVEARNASARLGMDMGERRGSLLEETEDVDRGEQILLKGDGEQMSKNNESSTSERTASELGQPTQEGAALATFDAKVDRNAERSKN